MCVCVRVTDAGVLQLLLVDFTPEMQSTNGYADVQAYRQIEINLLYVNVKVHIKAVITLLPTSASFIYI